MGSHPQGGGIIRDGDCRNISGVRIARDGITVALLTGMLDQATKLWLYYAYDLAAKSPVKVLPVLDLVLTWNKGISYGLFQQDSAFGQWMLFGVKVFAVIFLWVWLSQAATRLTAAGARAHYWRGFWQCGRPPGAWRGDGFRAPAHAFIRPQLVCL